MNGMRKVLCVLMAMMLAAFALPSIAASTTKYFYAVFPTVVLNTGAAGNENISLTINNSTPPPGVATINSMEIDAPAGVTINSISNGTLTPRGGGVYYVNNMIGIKSGQSKSLTLNVTVDGPNCVLETWGIFANAGNAYPQGDSFIDQHPAAENLNSAVGCDGTLVCDTQITNVNPTLDGGQHSVLGRGPKDADGSSCGTNAVPYSTDFIMLATQTFVFTEISGSQHPTVEYVLSWNAVAVTAWPNSRPTVAWLNTNGTPTSQPGTPAFIDALACLSDDLSNPTGIMPFMPVTGSPYNVTAVDTVRAKMCIAEHGWALVNGQIQYWDRVIDQADGFVGLP